MPWPPQRAAMSSRHAGGAAHPPAKRDGASGGSQRLARGGAHAARGYAPEGSGPWESQSGRDGLGSRREALDVEAQAQPWPATRPSGALPARAVSTGRGGATPGRTRQTAPAASQKGLLRRLPSEARGWVKLRIEPCDGGPGLSHLLTWRAEAGAPLRQRAPAVVAQLIHAAPRLQVHPPLDNCACHDSALYSGGHALRGGHPERSQLRLLTLRRLCRWLSCPTSRGPTRCMRLTALWTFSSSWTCLSPAPRATTTPHCAAP